MDTTAHFPHPQGLPPLPPTPPGWIAVWDPNYSTHYDLDTQTGVTQWQSPCYDQTAAPHPVLARRPKKSKPALIDTLAQKLSDKREEKRARERGEGVSVPKARNAKGRGLFVRLGKMREKEEWEEEREDEEGSSDGSDGEGSSSSSSSGSSDDNDVDSHVDSDGDFGDN